MRGRKQIGGADFLLDIRVTLNIIIIPFHMEIINVQNQNLKGAIA